MTEYDLNDNQVWDELFELWAKETGLPDLFAEGVNDQFTAEYDKGWRPGSTITPVKGCFVLVTSTSGVTEGVSVNDTEEDIIARLHRWLPELRAGRVKLQDFGYKKSVLSENGLRSYEIFKALNKS